jgi:hypothetical protein
MKAITFGLLICACVFLAVVIASCSGDSSLSARATATPPWSSCGVALADHNVKIWVEGSYAVEACEMIISSEKADFEHPIWWVKERVSGEGWDGYFVVCSDKFSDLRYEVIDTGGARYGTAWCHLMTKRFGTAPYPVEADLFNLIESAWED